MQSFFFPHKNSDTNLIRLPEDITMLGFTPIDNTCQITNKTSTFYCDRLEDLDSVQNMLRFERIRSFIDEHLCDGKSRILEKRKSSLTSDSFEYICRIASNSIKVITHTLYCRSQIYMLQFCAIFTTAK